MRSTKEQMFVKNTWQVVFFRMEACVPKSTTLPTTDDCTTHVPHVPLMFNSWCLWPYDKDKAEVDSDDEVGLKENSKRCLASVGKKMFL